MYVLLAIRVESGPLSNKRIQAQNFLTLSNPQTKLVNIAHCKINAIATKLMAIFDDNSYRLSLVELSKFLRFCTGSSYLPPPSYRDRLISVKFDGQAPGVATSTCIIVQLGSHTCITPQSHRVDTKVNCESHIMSKGQ